MILIHLIREDTQAHLDGHILDSMEFIRDPQIDLLQNYKEVMDVNQSQNLYIEQKTFK